MTEANYELGRISSLKPDAVGEPGSRRFRILVESAEGEAAILWMEKEQLFNLGLALKGIIATVGIKQEYSESPIEDVSLPFTSTAHPIEFQVEELSVGYDEQSTLYIISAHTGQQVEGDQTALSLLANQQDIDAFADEAFEVCAAGRPQCPLCGNPIDKDGHICPRHNGHATIEG